MTWKNIYYLTYFGGSDVQVVLVGFLAPGLTRPGSECWSTGLLSGGSGNDLLLRSCNLLAESSSCGCKEWGLCFLPRCQLGAILSFWRLLSSSCIWHLCLRAVSGVLNPSLSWNLFDFLFHISYFLFCLISLIPAGEISLLLGHMWLDWIHPDNPG